MKKILLVMLLLGVSGCAGFQNNWKHAVSSVTGLNRTITRYDNAGKPIKTWNTKAQLEYKGGGVCFLTLDSKMIYVSGTVTVEEH